MLRTVIFSIIFLVICEHVTTEGDTDCCDGCKRTYVRVKRGKFYPSPPQRYYSRPPSGFPIKGPYSYTPPPFVNDNGPSYPGVRPYKVSKRPTNDGLRDEDINNLVKYLTKKDLDKIVEFAYEKGQTYDNIESTEPPHIVFENPRFKENEVDVKFISQDTPVKEPHETEFSKYINYVAKSIPVESHPSKYVRHIIPDSHIDTAENMHKSQTYANPNTQKSIPNSQRYVQQSIPLSNTFIGDTVHKTILDSQPYVNLNWQKSFGDTQNYAMPNTQENNLINPINVPLSVNENIPLNHHYMNENTQSTFKIPENGNPYFTESTEEENLPKPLNMRDEDFEASHTNNVPTVVKAESTSYKVEDFGNLPLMNYYDSKLHSVSSYHVPHYTVTTSSRQPAPTYVSSSSSTSLVPSPSAAFIKAPPLEPAPPKYAAKEQSDAHLKATKIWTHRSKGTAYTLHNDGTLSLEIPGRPKYG